MKQTEEDDRIRRIVNVKRREEDTMKRSPDTTW